MVAVGGYLITNLEATAAVAAKSGIGVVVSILFRHGARQGRLPPEPGEFNKLIWKIASPKWAFDDATYRRTAASFNNPDHVES